MNCLRRSILTLVVLSSLTTRCYGQTSTVLTLLGPAELSVGVGPVTYQVVVSGPNTIRPETIALVGTGPLGIIRGVSAGGGGTVYIFPVAVSSTTPVGEYSFKAMARASSGLISSRPLSVRVRSAAVGIRRISVQPAYLSLPYPGSALPISVIAKTEAGTSRTITKDAVSYMFDRPEVAQITNGVVTGLTTGFATLKVAFGGVETTVAITVKGAIPGDLDDDGDVDLDDIAEARDFLNQVSAVPRDGRDLNSDGKIDALDLRILATLCSRPRCAIE